MKQAARAAARERVVAEIRLRRALGMAKPRRRVPKQLPPRGVEREYAKALREVVARLSDTLVSEVVSQLPAWSAEASRELDHLDSARLDAGIASKIAAFIRTIGDRLRAAIRPDALADLARRFADRTTDWSRVQTNRQVRAAVGVDVFTAEPALAAMVDVFVVENVALVTRMGADELASIEGTVLRGVTSGALPRDIAAQLAEQVEITKRRATLIARDQVGKLYGNVNKVRQQKLGVTKFTWTTVQDNRVRTEHEDRAGRVYSWTAEDATDEAPWLGAEELPGQPINCRCSGEPVLDDLLAGL